MAILLTGGLGYIGSHICTALLPRGEELIVVDNLSNASADVLPRLRAITGREPVFHRLDLRDSGALSAVFDRYPIDCVIHLAGLKAVGESVSKPLAYYDANLGGTLSLCRVMDAHGVRRLVFSSSAAVYSAGNAMPVSESGRTGDCINPYSWSKYMQEQLLRDLAAADARWSILLLRYFNPIGAHESGLIGEAPQGTPNNLLPYLTQVACGQQAYLSIYGNDYNTPDGTGVRDYLHVMDLAEGHIAAVDYTAAHHGAQAVNLGTGRGTSVLELVQAFERVNGIPVPYRFAPRRPGDLPTCYADAQLSAQLLHWRARRGLDDMLRDAWRWQQTLQKHA